ncbi:MAG TPA: MgtC/SapB family protein [Allosphingosinicella sp.]|jgi:putative Mg2+ transporter-C (MgtC) family protein
MNEILGSNPFNIVPHIFALAAAYLLALPVGWNREKEERSAGLRTFPLVAVAACGFVQAAESLTAHEPEAMARIVEGIITGMGFIGGGAILRLKDSVKGTATAASLWATGAMGTAVGLGSYDVAIVLSLITLLTLWVLSPLKTELVPDGPARRRRRTPPPSGTKAPDPANGPHRPGAARR